MTLEEENRKLKAEISSLKKIIEQDTYRILFEATPDIVIQVDLEFNILICHIPGFPKDRLNQLKGVNIFPVTPEPLHEKMNHAFKETLRLRAAYSYESEGEVLGSYRYYSNYMAPILDANGTIESVYFISREISLQKFAEKQILDNERKLQALFGSSKHIHILLALDGSLLWFNKKATETAITLFGKELEVGTPMYDYLNENNRLHFISDLQTSLSGQVTVYERTYRINGDTEYFYLEMMLQPIYDGNEMIGISLVGVDITERKKTAENLEKVNYELVQQNQRLNQYSYIISHNLRGPIATLLGLVQLFEQNTDKLFREEIIGHIKTSSSHLDTIIVDLNTVLSQSEQAIYKTRVSLEEEIQTALALLKSQVEEADATIMIEVKNELYTVKSFIQSILLNLLSNSLKYRKRNTPLSISIKTEVLDPTITCLYFSDNGMGIDMENNRDKIFGIYKRFHPQIEGRGLGLHLVKTQMELMGGKIEVESKLGEGTTFLLFFGE